MTVGTQSNLLGSERKPTRPRAYPCERCGTVNISTTKEKGMQWHMRFICKTCGMEYYKPIGNCHDV